MRRTPSGTVSSTAKAKAMPARFPAAIAPNPGASVVCATIAGVADEVERKFRVGELPPDLGEGTPLRQAYLALDGDVEVRVRDRGGRGVLTVKGGRGLRRTEVEVPIGRVELDELWALAGDRYVEKTRYEVAVDDRVAEVDV